MNLRTMAEFQRTSPLQRLRRGGDGTASRRDCNRVSGGPAGCHGQDFLSTLPKLWLQDGMQSILPSTCFFCRDPAYSCHGAFNLPTALSHFDAASRQLANSLSLKSSGAKTSKGIGNKGSSWWKWVCSFPTTKVG